jgi:hypothetical protein
MGMRGRHQRLGLRSGSGWIWFEAV